MKQSRGHSVDEFSIYLLYEFCLGRECGLRINP